jgi:EmrB/QacA subfamily drug resistance transporter
MEIREDWEVSLPEGYERRWSILAVLVVSLLVIGLDNTVLNVALPTLVRTLHATETQLQWMVDSYILLFAALLLTMGSLGDRLGRRFALQFGLLVFGTGSVLSAFAGSPTELIFTRAFMGIGAAAIMPSTLSILTNVFPDKERSRAIGVWAGFSVISIAIGPILGGWLLEHFWWGSVFLVNVPVVLVALMAGQLIVPNTKDPDAPRLDPVGALLSAVGLVFLVYGIIEVPTKGWGSALIITSMATGVLVLAAFTWWEVRSAHPMLNLRFFRNRSFSGANVTITLAFFAMSSALFLLTQYLQFVLGYTPLQTGVRLLPLIATFVIAPISGRLVEPVGNKILVGGGMIVAALGLFVFSETTRASSYGHTALSLVILGIGLYTAIVPATNSVMGSLPLGKAGVGSAMNDTTRQVGGALGVAVLGSILTSSYRASIGSSLFGLPSNALAVAKSSLGGALAVGGQVGGAAGSSIVSAAKTSFVQAVGHSAEVGVLFVVASAATAILFLPNHVIPYDAQEPATEAEEAAAQGPMEMEGEVGV